MIILILIVFFVIGMAVFNVIGIGLAILAANGKAQEEKAAATESLRRHEELIEAARSR